MDSDDNFQNFGGKKEINEVEIENDEKNIFNFFQNKKMIISDLQFLVRNSDSNDTFISNFPLQKIKKNNNEHNYTINIFQKDTSMLRKSYISDKSGVSISSKQMLEESYLMRSPVLEEKNRILKKMGSDNGDFFTNDEFNSVEKRKIEKFDVKYTFENNNNNISILNKYNANENSTYQAKNSGYKYENYNNSFSDSNPKESFLSFLEQTPKTQYKSAKNSEFFLDSSQKLLNTNINENKDKDIKEFDSFREKSSNELVGIKEQMKTLESNLNSILDKLNQQIVNSKLSLTQGQSNVEDLNITQNNSQKGSDIYSNQTSNQKPPLVQKKVIVIQKRKESLKPSQSPLKTRVDPETHNISKNLSSFCKELVEEAKISKSDSKQFSNDKKDEFSILNLFKNYEEKYLDPDQNKANKEIQISGKEVLKTPPKKLNSYKSHQAFHQSGKSLQLSSNKNSHF